MTEAAQNTAKKRYNIIDIIRTVAILLMIKYHLAYDMYLFGWNSINFQKDSYWYILPRFIVFLFLIAVGACQTLEHFEKVNWDKVKKRFLKIFGCALLVSIATYVLFPQRWVYFGTLHCIAFSSVAILPFMKKPQWAFNTGLFIVFSNLFIPKDILPLSDFFGVRSMDYVPFYPWVGVALFGMAFILKGYHETHIPLGPLTKPVQFLSKNALWVYLIHQPVLYGICYLISKSS